MKKIQVLTITLFILVLLVPILMMNRKPNQVSLIDNTTLPEWSDVIHSEDWALGVENYLSSRIGFRPGMINGYMNLNDRLFGMLMHPTYTYGREGYIFFHMKEEALDGDYLDTFADFVKSMQENLEREGKTFLYCVNPNKTVVYSEYLPKGVLFTFPRQEHLLNRLQENNVSFIDNTPILIDAKDEVQVFNVKYDAGHWNDNGAFLGISHIITRLQNDHPNIPSLTKDMFSIEEVDVPYLGLSNFVINDVTDVYTRIETQAVPVADLDADLKLHENYRDFSYYRNPKRQDLPKILVFRGSYFLERETFMADHFSEAVFIHSYHNIFRYPYYCDLFDPDIVLFESVEYATKNSYFPLKKMERALERNK